MGVPTCAYRLERVRCNAHLPVGCDPGEWIPLVVDADGDAVWHSARSGRYDEWCRLADANPAGLTWRDALRDGMPYGSVRVPMSDRAERYAFQLRDAHGTPMNDGGVMFDTRWASLPNTVLRAWANDMVALEDAVLAAGMQWVMPDVVIGDSGMPEARWPIHGAPGRKMVARWRFDLADVVYQYSQVSADTIE